MIAVEYLEFGLDRFEVGTEFRTTDDYRVLKLVELFEHRGVIEAVVAYDSKEPEIMLAENLAYYITIGFLTPVARPKYQNGQQFTHLTNNNTIEIIQNAPAPDKMGMYQYLVLLIDAMGQTTYTIVDEAYLDKCPVKEKEVPNFAPPLIPEDAQKPEVKIGHGLTLISPLN